MNNLEFGEEWIRTTYRNDRCGNEVARMALIYRQFSADASHRCEWDFPAVLGSLVAIVEDLQQALCSAMTSYWL